MLFRNAKSILSPQNGMNLYRGCTHGCIYCDSRSACYGFDHDFEEVEVKSNAPVLLEETLRRKKNGCMITTGSMCDPYQPAEKELCLTRNCLEIIDRHGFGLALHTKSATILRDLDLLIHIRSQSKCVVQMTLTTYDEKLCKILEPHVSTSAERFKVLKILHKFGIPTIVWLSPILPFINDTEENIRGILEYCADAGVMGVICFGMGLTLREGNRAYFYQKLDEHFPGLKQKYIQQFGNSYAVVSPANAALMRFFHTYCEALHLLHDNEALFSYLHTFETRGGTQQRLF